MNHRRRMSALVGTDYAAMRMQRRACEQKGLKHCACPFGTCLGHSASPHHPSVPPRALGWKAQPAMRASQAPAACGAPATPAPKACVSRELAGQATASRGVCSCLQGDAAVIYHLNLHDAAARRRQAAIRICHRNNLINLSQARQRQALCRARSPGRLQEFRTSADICGERALLRAARRLVMLMERDSHHLQEGYNSALQHQNVGNKCRAPAPKTRAWCIPAGRAGRAGANAVPGTGPGACWRCWAARSTTG